MNLKKAYSIYRKIQIKNLEKISKETKSMICKTCFSEVKCHLCKRFGKIEGQKWYLQNKYYLSE